MLIGGEIFPNYELIPQLNEKTNRHHLNDALGKLLRLYARDRFEKISKYWRFYRNQIGNDQT